MGGVVCRIARRWYRGSTLTRYEGVGVLVEASGLVCDPVRHAILVLDVLLVRFGGVVVLCHRTVTVKGELGGWESFMGIG